MADSINSKPVSTLHLAWAAGFMEGEGSFSHSLKQSPKVSAAQVQREPVERLQKLFGGKITQRRTRGFSKQPIWVWTISARRSVEVMMTLYVLMSPRRQEQIRQTLDRWKAQKRILRSHGSKVCGNGHDLVGGNVYISKGRLHCRACRLRAKRDSRARNPVPVAEFDLRNRRGYDSPNSKLTSEQASEILSALARKEPQKSLARRFGVSQSLISDIKIRGY